MEGWGNMSSEVMRPFLWNNESKSHRRNGKQYHNIIIPRRPYMAMACPLAANSAMVSDGGDRSKVSNTSRGLTQAQLDFPVEPHLKRDSIIHREGLERD